MQDNPYEILQVSEKAEQEVIEAAYRRLARKYHPDTNPQPSANDHMQKLNWAYELLINPIKRAEYDFLSHRRNATNQNAQDFSYREPEREKNKASDFQQNRTSYAETPAYKETNKVKVKKPSIIQTISISILLLVGYYVFTITFVIASYGFNKIFTWILIIISFILFLVLARVAAIGWNPNRKSFLRTLLMLILTFFPIFTWVPCYLASKVITKGNLIEKEKNDWRLKTSIAIYGIASMLLSMYLFGNIFSKVGTWDKSINYLLFDNPEIGISFMYPDIFEIESQIDKQRTDFGTIFTVSNITGVSYNPVLSMGIQITEDPTRNILFPELYPPDDTAIELLALRDLTKIPLLESESFNNEINNAYKDLIINSYSGFPAVEYKLNPLDTAIGDAVIYGVLIVSDKRDISITRIPRHRISQRETF